MSHNENYTLEELFDYKNFSSGFLRQIEECIEATNNRMMKYENEVWSILKPDYTFEDVGSLEEAILAFGKIWQGREAMVWISEMNIKTVFPKSYEDDDCLNEMLQSDNGYHWSATFQNPRKLN